MTTTEKLCDAYLAAGREPHYSSYDGACAILEAADVDMERVPERKVEQLSEQMFELEEHGFGPTQVVTHVTADATLLRMYAPNLS